MKVRTKATLDGLALELTTRIYDLTTARALTPNEQAKRLNALEQALNLTLEVLEEAQLELRLPQEDTHVQTTQH